MAKAKKKKKSHTKLVVGAVLAAILIVLLGLHFVKPSVTVTTHPTPTPTIIPALVVSSDPHAKCHSNGVLPDANCTPGSIDPNVTQANIQQTICVSGYTKTVRPPVSFTNNLKKEQIGEYGYVDSNLHDYEEDHLISLELGGAPSDPKNLWPEPGGSPNPKDHIENVCHKKVCDGTILLAQAQKQIATNWQTACQ